MYDLAARNDCDIISLAETHFWTCYTPRDFCLAQLYGGLCKSPIHHF